MQQPGGEFARRIGEPAPRISSSATFCSSFSSFVGGTKSVSQGSSPVVSGSSQISEPSFLGEPLDDRARSLCLFHEQAHRHRPVRRRKKFADALFADARGVFGACRACPPKRIHRIGGACPPKQVHRVGWFHATIFCVRIFRLRSTSRAPRYPRRTSFSSDASPPSLRRVRADPAASSAAVESSQ